MYSISVVVFVVDRLAKTWAAHNLFGRRPIVLIPHVLDLHYTTNSGGAFGLFGGQPWLFFTASLAVCVAIVLASFRLSGSLSAVGLGLLLGGAVGNLADRVINGAGLRGRVVDFIHLHLWPVFNLADTAIVIGAILIVLHGLHRRS
jgi:signal peptidase II